MANIVKGTLSRYSSESTTKAMDIIKSLLTQKVQNTIDDKYCISYESDYIDFSIFNNFCSYDHNAVNTMLMCNEMPELCIRTNIYFIEYYKYYLNKQVVNEKSNLLLGSSIINSVAIKNLIDEKSYSKNNIQSCIKFKDGCIINFQVIVNYRDSKEDIYNRLTKIKITFLGINAIKESNKLIRYIGKKERLLKKYKQNQALKPKIREVMYNVYSGPNIHASYVHAKYINNIFSPHVTELKSIIESFIDDAEFYNNHNLPHVSRILLYGVPGTGKTSLVNSLINYSIILRIKKDTEDERFSNSHTREEVTSNIFINSNSLTENTLVKIKDNNCNLNIAIEEIDASINRDTDLDKKDADEKMKILSNLLELLDGIYTPNNALFFATTNHIENLDPALLRRFDHKINIDNISKEYIVKLIKDLHGSIDDVFEHINPDKNGNYNPDTVQKYIINQRKNKK